MTTIEMISALHEIKRTCERIYHESKRCIDCPFHGKDEEGDIVCGFYNLTFTENAFGDPMFNEPMGWNLDELEG